jgi:hypothetical protein
MIASGIASVLVREMMNDQIDASVTKKELPATTTPFNETFRKNRSRDSNRGVFG